MADEELEGPVFSEDMELPLLPRPTRWGLVVIGLSYVARTVQCASEMVEANAKFWCELAMAAAGQSNHETAQRAMIEQAGREIETLTSGAFDASSIDPGRG